MGRVSRKFYSCNGLSCELIYIDFIIIIINILILTWEKTATHDILRVPYLVYS